MCARCVERERVTRLRGRRRPATSKVWRRELGGLVRARKLLGMCMGESGAYAVSVPVKVDASLTGEKPTEGSETLVNV